MPSLERSLPAALLQRNLFHDIPLMELLNAIPLMTFYEWESSEGSPSVVFLQGTSPVSPLQ